MIFFDVKVSIPRHIVEQIGKRIKMSMLSEMRLITHTYDHYRYRDRDIEDAERRIDRAIKAVANSDKKSCEGYILNKEQVCDISMELRNGHKIAAIEIFREHTGCGLREAKYIIDKFGTGDLSAMEFEGSFI